MLYFAYQFKDLLYGSYGQHLCSCSVFLYISYCLSDTNKQKYRLEGPLNSRYSTNFKKITRNVSVLVTVCLSRCMYTVYLQLYRNTFNHDLWQLKRLILKRMWSTSTNLITSQEFYHKKLSNFCKILFRPRFAKKWPLKTSLANETRCEYLFTAVEEFLREKRLSL